MFGKRTAMYKRFLFFIFAQYSFYEIQDPGILALTPLEEFKKKYKVTFFIQKVVDG